MPEFPLNEYVLFTRFGIEIQIEVNRRINNDSFRITAWARKVQKNRKLTREVSFLQLVTQKPAF